MEHDSAAMDAIDSDEGKEAYYKEIERYGCSSRRRFLPPADPPPLAPRSPSLLLSTLPGSTRVKVFNSTIRRKAHNSPSVGTARTPENTGPVARAHNDNTPATGAKRVTLEMGDEAEELSKGRCQVRQAAALAVLCRDWGLTRFLWFRRL